MIRIRRKHLYNITWWMFTWWLISLDRRYVTNNYAFPTGMRRGGGGRQEKEEPQGM